MSVSKPDVQYASLITCLLGGMFGVVFGQFIIFGELIKPVTLYFQVLHEANPTDHPDVIEWQTVDLAFTNVVCNITAGVVVMFINLVWKLMTNRASKQSPEELEGKKRTRHTAIFLIATVGFIMFTVGCQVIGWERPAWRTFVLMMMVQIAPGGGLLTWGALILLSSRISEEGLKKSLTDTVMLGLFISAPCIFAIIFYPTLHAYVTAPSTLNEFHLVFRSVGTLCTPLLAIMMLIALLEVIALLPTNQKKSSKQKVEDSSENQPLVNSFSRQKIDEGMGFNGKKRPMPQASEKSDKSESTPHLLGRGGVITFFLFVISKAVFAPVFFGTQVLFSNYLIHVNGSAQAVDLDHSGFGFDSISEMFEADMIRSCVLLMAAGGLFGRLVLTLAAGSGWEISTLVRLLMHAVAVAVTGGWHSRSLSKSFSEGSLTDLGTIAFFTGFANGAVFFDGFLCCLWTHWASIGEEGVAREMRLLVLLLMTGAVMATVRFGTGFFGAMPEVVNYPHFTLILTILSGTSFAVALLAAMFSYNPPKNSSRVDNYT